MNDRFEMFLGSIMQIYRCFQQMKMHEMSALGLRGTHLLCLYYLQKNPLGLTSAQLCTLSGEDKAAVSRAISELEEKGLVTFEDIEGRKRYRTIAILTAIGRDTAQKMDAIIEKQMDLNGIGIDDKEREIFYRVLQQISTNMQNTCKTINLQERKGK